MDVEEHRSTQLDVLIFDGANVSPLWIDDDIVLIPAESLLAVIEVKTRLTREEYRNCCRAVRSLSKLRPHGEPFIPVRTMGAPADDNRLRCLYSIIAFDSDLATADWATKEWNRFLEVCAEEEVDASNVDRILILGRGLIVPPHSSVVGANEDGEHALLGRWFLHLSQFLTREVARRPDFEWAPYRDERRGWSRLSPIVPSLAEPVTRKDSLGQPKERNDRRPASTKAAASSTQEAEQANGELPVGKPKV